MALLLILYSISFVSGVALPFWVWAIAWSFFLLKLFFGLVGIMLSE